MGAWCHLLLHLPEAKIMRVASRRMYGSPAAGSSTRFNKRHKEVIDYVQILNSFSVRLYAIIEKQQVLFSNSRHDQGKDV